MSKTNIIPFPVPEPSPRGRRGARPSAQPQRRMFLDTDYNSNWYLIPVAKRRQWRKWLVANEKVYRPNLPSYVIHAGEDVSLVEVWVDEADIMANQPEAS